MLVRPCLLGLPFREASNGHAVGAASIPCRHPFVSHDQSVAGFETSTNVKKKTRQPRRLAESTASARKHQNRRHVRTGPLVPREDREDAVEYIIARYPQHGHAILFYARAGAVAAQKVDSLMRFTEWLRDAVPHALKLGRPGAFDVIDIPFKDDTMEGSESTAALAERARSAVADLLRVLRDAVCLNDRMNSVEVKPQLERQRDTHLMMGAMALRYAKERALDLDLDDLAYIEVAVGLRDAELHADPRRGYQRWYGREQDLIRLVEHVRVGEVRTSQDGLGDDFYDSPWLLSETSPTRSR